MSMVKTVSFILKNSKTAGIDHRTDTGTGLFMTMLISWAPMIFLLLLIFFFISRSARAGGGPGGMLGNFGKSKHRLAKKIRSKLHLTMLQVFKKPKKKFMK